MRFLYILLALLLSSGSYAQGPMTALQYIDTYKDIAIAEMKRTGIPASITLAQGLIESGNGNSSLSKQSNNHFGIKCKKDWAGRTVNYDDDAPQECFRAYERAEDSYKDHSDFLRNNTRYAFLFDLEPTDYESWAKGLKQAGYATNPKYAEMLVTAIEKYSLYQYDIGNTRIPLPDGRPGQEPVFAQNKEKELTTFNGIRAYVVKPGDTYLGIVEANFMMRWEIARYNDLENRDDPRPGAILYLKPKLRKAKEEYHIVKEGEGMYYISQLHAIRLKSLYKLNRMQPGQEPAPGEKLYLRKKRESAPVLSSKPVPRKPLMQREPEKNKPEQIEPEKEAVTLESEVLIPGPGPDNTAKEKLKTAGDRVHIVNAGETLYAISKKYNVSVDALKSANDLADNTISIGQTLRIP